MFALFEKLFAETVVEDEAPPKMKPWIHIPPSHIITIHEQDPFLHTWQTKYQTKYQTKSQTMSQTKFQTKSMNLETSIMDDPRFQLNAIICTF